MTETTIGIPGASTPAPRDEDQGRLRRLAQMNLRFAMLWILLGLVIAAQVVYPSFLTVTNLENLLTQNANVGIVAAGMTFVMISGGFDLSVTGTVSLGSVLFAGLCYNSHLPVPFALLLSMLVGAGCGLLNGLVIGHLRVNAFVATLGTATAFDGVAALYSHSQPITVAGVPGFGYVGAGRLLGLPVPIVLLGGSLLLGGLVLRSTAYGRKLYAVGGNNEAARLAGLPTDRIRTIAFVVCGIGAAFAGAMLASTLSAGQADQLPTVALDSIAAVVIGGTSLYGGEGAMWRTAVGVMILGTLNNLFSSLAVQSPVQNVIKGGVVIVAVALETVSRRRR
jgi:ribose transport system permease protein